MGRNKYTGKWTEPKGSSLNIPFTCENLQMLLYKIVSKEGVEYSQKEFVNWCEDFYLHLEENDNTITGDTQYKILTKILNDISAQWELYLVNTYSLEELQKLDLFKIELPFEWFENWLKIIEMSDMFRTLQDLINNYLSSTINKNELILQLQNKISLSDIFEYKDELLNECYSAIYHMDEEFCGVSDEELLYYRDCLEGKCKFSRIDRDKIIKNLYKI